MRCSICGFDLTTVGSCPNAWRADHNILNPHREQPVPLTPNETAYLEALMVLKQIRDLLEVIAEKAGWNGHYSE